MRNRASWFVRLASLLLVAAMLLVLMVPAASADDISRTRGFRKSVTLDGIREHQAAFQSFADASDGKNRLSGTSGFDASAQYVYDRMAAAGYDVSFQEFTFLLVSDRTPPVLQQVSPTAKTYVDGPDYQTMQYSGSGDVTALLTAVDLLVPSPAPNSSTSGCEAEDFAGFPAGSIALMQRGTCSFRIKADNAAAAGATAVIIFNEGSPGRAAAFGGALNPPLLDRPVVGASFAVGDELRNGVLNGPTSVIAHLRTDTIAEPRTTRNVIAETTGGNPNRVIVVGAHLDSVSRGPGINDNGSGSATILEVAEVFAEQERVPRNRLRFMWYAAEEGGLIGSTFYVNSLSQAERDRIELMLNFDMIGSPNFVRFVYDGNNSTFPAGPGVQPGPPGSGAIEQVFLDYFASQGLLNEAASLSGRSDYGPFISSGIPIGGLFTGAEGAKTARQAVDYGGVAHQRYDPCYHLACDTFEGSGGGATYPLALTGLDQMSDAVAHAVLLFSRRNFAFDPLVDPAVSASAGVSGANAAQATADAGPVDR